MSQAKTTHTTRRAFIGGVAAAVPVAASLPAAVAPATLVAAELADRELVQLSNEYLQTIDTFNSTTWSTTEEAEEAFLECVDLIEEALEIPAQTPVGLWAKIQMFDGITDQLKGSGDLEDMWNSLCSDIRRLAGVSDQVVRTSEA